MVRPVVLAVALIGTAYATAAPPNTRAELEEMADGLNVFPAGSFANNNLQPRDLSPELTDRYAGVVRRFRWRQYPVPDLVTLLKHPRAKVRTLAAAALFDRDDPKLLPHIVPLVTDPGHTFLIPESCLNCFGPPPLVPQTVGQAVAVMLNLYLPKADHMRYGALPGKKCVVFDDYWASRKDRSHCASWFEVQLERACGGISPTQEDRIDDIREVRRRIDRLPEPDRTLTLFWLRPSSCGGDELVNDADLVTGCRAIGPDGLIKLLQRKPPTDDPDIRAKPSDNYRYRTMQLFVLDHAGDLLRAQDADTLLACRAWEADHDAHKISDPTRTPLWRIAAAALRPADAGRLLDEARAEFRDKYDSDHRRRIAQAYWRLIPSLDPAVVANWFYEEKPDLSAHPHALAQFLSDLGPKPRPEDHRLVAALLADERLTKLDWQSMVAFARLANAWEGRPVISPSDLEATIHKRKDDEEMARTLDGWRATLRAWAKTLRDPS